MAHSNQLHRRLHDRRQFNWEDPGAALLSLVESPFEDPAPTPAPKTGAKTIVSVVYSTASKTFSGPIGGYITPTSDNRPKTTIKVSQAKPLPTTSSTKTTIKASVGADSTSTPHSTNGSGLLEAQSTSASVSPSATSAGLSQNSVSSSATGISSGAKAGIAFGVIAGLAAVLLLIFFCVRRHRNSSERERLDDEKSASNWDSGAFEPAAPLVTRDVPSSKPQVTNNTPRLGLRPVTEFTPGFNGSDRPASNAMSARNVPASGQSSWERPMSSNDQSRENPFGNHAEAAEPANTTTGPSAATGAAGAVAGAAAGGAAVNLARGASKRGNGPKPLDFTKNNLNFNTPAVPSPTGTDYSVNEAQGAQPPTNGAAAIAAAGGPRNASVHRVQLDFKPSMDDELELRAGQLIRLLHEYDDGWALCIRLDRSQQGVVPRTCLSTRPVKPRNNGPPPNGPGARGPPRNGPPQGMRGPGYPQQGRPMSPANNMGQRSQSPAPYAQQGRPMSPSMGPRSQSPAPRPQQGRPMSPAMGPRSQSPAPYPNDRSMTPTGRNSPAGGRPERRLTPPGPSPMNPGSLSKEQPQQQQSPSSPKEPEQEKQASPQPSPTLSAPPQSQGSVPGRKPVPGQAI